jgi:hypothetical protein
MSANPESLERALYSSNGGRSGQVYASFSSTINLNQSLDQKLYSTTGDFQNDACPFIIGAMLVNSDSTKPTGQLEVTYEYEFQNPFSSGITFETKVNELATDYTNSTIVGLSSTTDCGAFQLYQQELDKVYVDGIEKPLPTSYVSFSTH